jgi:hypothetical protein
MILLLGDKNKVQWITLSGLPLEDCIVLHEKNLRGSGVGSLFLKKNPALLAEACFIR